MTAFGYKVVNSDNAFEMSKKSRMEMTADNIFLSRVSHLGIVQQILPNKENSHTSMVDLVWLLTELVRTTKKIKNRKSN